MPSLISFVNKKKDKRKLSFNKMLFSRTWIASMTQCHLLIHPFTNTGLNSIAQWHRLSAWLALMTQWHCLSIHLFANTKVALVASPLNMLVHWYLTCLGNFMVSPLYTTFQWNSTHLSKILSRPLCWSFLITRRKARWILIIISTIFASIILYILKPTANILWLARRS